MDTMEPTCNECTPNNLSNNKKLGKTDKIVKNRSISKKISPELAGGKIVYLKSERQKPLSYSSDHP